MDICNTFNSKVKKKYGSSLEKFLISLYKSQKIDHLYKCSTGILGRYLICEVYGIGRNIE